MPRKSSILSSKKTDKKPLQIRIPSELKEDLDNLQERLEKIAPELSFDTNEILADALEDAIKAANKELDKIAKDKPTATSNGMQQSPAELASG